MLKQIGILCLCLALCACGFHLRGAVQVDTDKQPIFVSSADPYSRLTLAFLTEFHQHKIRTTPSIENAQIIVEIKNETVNKSILSLLSNGDVAEYNLNYQLQVQIRAPHSEQDPKWFTLSQQRDFEDNKQQVLGTEFEQEQLVIEMRKQAIQQIITIISANQF